MDSTNSLQPDWQINNVFFNRPIILYSNPGTQVAPQNKDFRTVLQTDLVRTLVPSVAQATLCKWITGEYYETVHLHVH